MSALPQISIPPLQVRGALSSEARPCQQSCRDGLRMSALLTKNNQEYKMTADITGNGWKTDKMLNIYKDIRMILRKIT